MHANVATEDLPAYLERFERGNLVQLVPVDVEYARYDIS